MKKIKIHIKFYFKTAMKNLHRHMGLSVSAAAAVSITLLLISVFTILSWNLNDFTYHIEEQLTMRVSLDSILTDEQKSSMQEEIKKIANVKEVTFHSGQEELEVYKKEYTEDSNLFSMYEGESSPIRDTFVIEVKDGNNLTAINDTLEKMKGVVAVEYGGNATTNLVSTFEKIRDYSGIFIVFLVLIAALLIGNKIKMSIYTRREEISVMRNVGAGNWFIKAPMMLEGVAIGFFGALLPIICTIVGYQAFYHEFHGEMLSNMFTLKDTFPMTILISLLLAAIGIIVGLIGSLVSTTRFLKRKR